VRTLAVAIVHRDRLVAEALAIALGRSSGIAIVSADTQVPHPPKRLDAAVVDAELPGAEMTVERLRAAEVRVVSLGSGVHADADVPADRAMAELADAIAPATPALRRTEGGALSPREREVLNLVAQGLSGKQIARQLGISPKTVEHHKTRAFAKLGVPNQAAAVAALMEEELTWIRAAI
jgi:DNA-binding CsgD family transcriptional regulator